jgi:hypothetical protein
MMAPATRGTVTATGIAGAVVVIVAWLIDHFAKIQIPPEVGAAAGTLIAAGLAPFIHTPNDELPGRLGSEQSAGSRP